MSANLRNATLYGIVFNNNLDSKTNNFWIVEQALGIYPGIVMLIAFLICIHLNSSSALQSLEKKKIKVVLVTIAIEFTSYLIFELPFIASSLLQIFHKEKYLKDSYSTICK